MTIAEKIADYVGSVNESDRELTIMFVEELLSKKEQAYSEMKDALEEVAHWRERCHDYDKDVGFPLRDFDEETVVMMEGMALGTLDRVKKYED